jgi:hypothetical protein
VGNNSKVEHTALIAAPGETKKHSFEECFTVTSGLSPVVVIALVILEPLFVGLRGFMTAVAPALVVLPLRALPVRPPRIIPVAVDPLLVCLLLVCPFLVRSLLVNSLLVNSLLILPARPDFDPSEGERNGCRHRQGDCCDHKNLFHLCTPEERYREGSERTVCQRALIFRGTSPRSLACYNRCPCA